MLHRNVTLIVDPVMRKRNHDRNLLDKAVAYISRVREIPPRRRRRQQLVVRSRRSRSRRLGPSGLLNAAQ